jgi:hypothetical protein
MRLRFLFPITLLLALPLAACGGQVDGSVFADDDAAVAGDTSTSVDSATEDTYVPPPVDATAPDTSPGKGGVGSPCTSSSQCQSGVCSGGKCRQKCSSSTECVAGWYCSGTPAGSYCACTPKGPDCGGLDNNCDGVVSSTAPCATPTPDSGTTNDAAGQSCTTCVQNQCSSEVQTCYFDATGCRPVFNCLQSCGTYTGTCAQACLAKYPAAKPVADCFAANCGGCK